jgi:hypothetical protein
MNKLFTQTITRTGAYILHMQDDSETSSGGSGTGTKGSKPKE